jgi:translation initiation factor IF-2
MRKIRINELAREIEVKAHLIIDILPELGVADKKTHSSSLDDDLADKIREHFGVHVERVRVSDEGQEPAEETSETVPAFEETTEGPELETGTAAPVEAAETEGADQAPAAPAPEAHLHPADADAETLAPPQRHPIRPPLATGPALPAVKHPPAGMVAPGAPAPTPAKPLPASPRPGQILSGPRQPFPGAVQEPGRPAVIPGAPRPPAPHRQPAPPPAASSLPESASPAPRVQTRPLAGQPTMRPVVPPRPDMVAKLAQARTLPAQPMAPRPGMPAPPRATPVPGQPIYKGPIRPGQPLVNRPGARVDSAAGRMMQRGRPLHPTSPLRPDSPPPAEAQRRAPDKRGGRTVDRDREREREEKTLRLPTSRRAPAGPPPIDRQITISEGITVKELSEKLGVKAGMVIKKLVDKKIFATINQTLDIKLAEEVSRDFGASIATISFELESVQEATSAEVEKDLIKRPPVVTIMGHVDHGKTSLLDAIRLTHVAEKEAGGITQHIGAYYVEKNGRKIVFIDTPGHEAFTRMRSRGAKVTDIVVLVVAADDGVMPQTLEAIDHAKAAGVPIVVAINKIDRPDAQPERIKQQLSDRGLLPEDWGGDTVMVPVSAKAKTNLELLLEMILLVADMQDLKANPGRPAVGSVLEAKLDRGRGPVATVLVRNGTLHIGDYFICGSIFGKVRAMFNDRGQPIRDAEPSMPVEVLGLEALPEVGDTYQVVTDTAKAKQIVIYREAKAREQAMSKNTRITLDQLHRQLQEGEAKELSVILKTDVGGTAEVLTDMLQKLSNEKVKIQVLHSGVGAITETDVLLASASNAVIIGFNVRPERTAAALAEHEKVDIRLHTIIYELTDEIKRAMTGMLEPVFKEVYKGRAEVRETFRITKVGMVAGCIVVDGTLTRDAAVRVLRDNVVVHTGKISSLRRFKDDVREVRNGLECGITLENYADIKPGDVYEAFVTERVATEAFA